MPFDTQAIELLANQTQLRNEQIKTVLGLYFDEKHTIPFLTRYRKESTGNLDEEQLRLIVELYEQHAEKEKRRLYILDALQKLEKLTPELEKNVRMAQTLLELEEIYAPYKSKKKTKAMLALELGLGPLSQLILTTSLSLKAVENEYLQHLVKKMPAALPWETAIEGAQHIILERFAHEALLKEKLREIYWKEAFLVSQKRPKAAEVKDFHKYQDFFDYKELIQHLKTERASHRFLALRRGSTQKVLKVEIQMEDAPVLALLNDYLTREFQGKKDKGLTDLLQDWIFKSYKTYIHPSLELEIKTELKSLAEVQAIKVFGTNLKNLLLAPYLGPKSVLGIDPGVRTGCKCAVVDQTGKYIEEFVIFPHEPRKDIAGSKKILEAKIKQHNIYHLAIGNGTYGRETLQFLEENIEQLQKTKEEGGIEATLISESGASVYSASEIARQEFPDLDATVRGAISIARRFQDPLAELVKIDPKSIGVGQYQHDVSETKLKKALHGIVESCVNYVGVDLNTASAPLLSFVAGIGPTLAEQIVSYRESKGLLKSRADLLQVPHFGPKAFEQSAGFLRIYGGAEPLDQTFVHPERYSPLKTWAQKNGVAVQQMLQNPQVASQLAVDPVLSSELGDLTLSDIIKSLSAPNQDPRKAFKSTAFMKKLRALTDLTIGTWYPGVITNITQFGAFVDIGLKEKGLVHLSELSNTYVEDPLSIYKVGQEIQVKVIGVDHERKRISLSCREVKVGPARAPAPSRENQQRGPNTGSRPSARPDRAPVDTTPRGPRQPAFKNNAFAGLKDFKVK